MPPKKGSVVEVEEVIERKGRQRAVRGWSSKSFASPSLARRFETLSSEAQTAFMKRDFSLAKRLVQEAFRIYASPSLMLLLSEIHHAQGHFNEAADMRLVQAVLAKDLVLWEEVLGELIEGNMFYRATLALSRMVSLVKDNETKISYLLQLGDLYVALGETTKAIAPFERVWRSSNYSHFEVFSTLSSMYFQQGKWNRLTLLIKQAMLYLSIAKDGLGEDGDKDDASSSASAASSSTSTDASEDDMDDDSILLGLSKKSAVRKKSEEQQRRATKSKAAKKKRDLKKRESQLQKTFGSYCNVKPFAKTRGALLHALFDEDSTVSMVDVLLNTARVVGGSVRHAEGEAVTVEEGGDGGGEVAPAAQRDEFSGFFDDEGGDGDGGPSPLSPPPPVYHDQMAGTTTPPPSSAAPLVDGTFGSALSIRRAPGDENSEVPPEELQRREYYTKLVNVLSELLLEKGQFTECVKLIRSTALTQFGIPVEELPVDLLLKLGLAYAYDGDSEAAQTLIRDRLVDKLCDPSVHADLMYDAAESLYRIGMYDLAMFIYNRLLRFARATDSLTDEELSAGDLKALKDRDAGFLLGLSKCVVKADEITDFAQRWRDAVQQPLHSNSGASSSHGSDSDDDFHPSTSRPAMPHASLGERLRSSCLACGFRSRFYPCRECGGERRLEGADVEALRHPAFGFLEELLFTLDPFNSAARLMLSSLLVEGYGDFIGAEEVLLPPRPLHHHPHNVGGAQNNSALSKSRLQQARSGGLQSSLRMLEIQTEFEQVPIESRSESGFQRFECDGALTFLYFNWASSSIASPMLIPALLGSMEGCQTTVAATPLSVFTSPRDIWVACFRVGSHWIRRLLQDARHTPDGYHSADHIGLQARRLLNKATTAASSGNSASPGASPSAPQSQRDDSRFDLSWLDDEEGGDDEDNWARMSMAPGSSAAGNPTGSAYSSRSALHLPSFTRASSAIVPVDRLSASLSGDLATSIGATSGVASSILGPAASGGRGYGPLSSALNSAIATSHRAGMSKNSVLLATRGVSTGGSSITSVVAGSGVLGSSVATTALTAKRNAQTGGATTVLSTRMEGGKSVVVSESVVDAIAAEKDAGGLYGAFRFNRGVKSKEAVAAARAAQRKEMRRVAQRRADGHDDAGSVGNLSDLDEFEDGNEDVSRPAHQGLEAAPMERDADGFALPSTGAASRPIATPASTTRLAGFRAVLSGSKRARSSDRQDDADAGKPTPQPMQPTVGDTVFNDDDSLLLSDGLNKAYEAEADEQDDGGVESAELPSLEDIAAKHFSADPEMSKLFLEAMGMGDSAAEVVNDAKSEEHASNHQLSVSTHQQLSVSTHQQLSVSTHQQQSVSAHQQPPLLSSSTPSIAPPPQLGAPGAAVLPSSLEASFEEFQHKRRPNAKEYVAMLKGSGYYATSTLVAPPFRHTLAFLSAVVRNDDGGERSSGSGIVPSFTVGGRHCSGVKRIERVAIMLVDALTQLGKPEEAHTFLALFIRNCGSIRKSFIMECSDCLVTFLKLALDLGKTLDVITVVKKILRQDGLFKAPAVTPQAGKRGGDVVDDAAEDNISFEQRVAQYQRNLRLLEQPDEGAATTRRGINGEDGGGSAVSARAHQRAVLEALSSLANGGLKSQTLGRMIEASSKSVAELLMIEGNVHFGSANYRLALSFYQAAERALKMTTATSNGKFVVVDPLLQLQLGVTFLYMAENRRLRSVHECVQAAFLYFHEYTRLIAATTPSKVPEALYNVARAYQQLRLFYLAAPLYERCITLADRLLQESMADAAMQAPTHQHRGFVPTANVNGEGEAVPPPLRAHIASLAAIRAAAGFNVALIYGKWGCNEPLAMSRLYSSGW